MMGQDDLRRTHTATGRGGDRGIHRAVAARVGQRNVGAAAAPPAQHTMEQPGARTSLHTAAASPRAQQVATKRQGAALAQNLTPAHTLAVLDEAFQWTPFF